MVGLTFSSIVGPMLKCGRIYTFKYDRTFKHGGTHTSKKDSCFQVWRPTIVMQRPLLVLMFIILPLLRSHWDSELLELQTNLRNSNIQRQHCHTITFSATFQRCFVVFNSGSDTVIVIMISDHRMQMKRNKHYCEPHVACSAYNQIIYCGIRSCAFSVFMIY